MMPFWTPRGSRKVRSEKTTDLVKGAAAMEQYETVGQTKDHEASGRKPSIATVVAIRGQIDYQAPSQ
jgi:hypothetical protein